MFVSVKYLHSEMGVDESIAKFFVDRKPPQGNAFWRNRLLYIGRGNGYKSIPVYYDLLHRCGISTHMLLREDHIRFMEEVMHYAISVEFGEISFRQQLNLIASLLKGRIQHPLFYGELMEYLSQPKILPMGRLGLEVPALNRADVFLFILCDMPMSDHQLDLAIRYWYALHSSYLLMDDIHDYKKDKEQGHENAVVELGDGQPGIERAFAILDKNIKTLEPVNPVLSQFIEQSLEGLHDLIQ